MGRRAVEEQDAQGRAGHGCLGPHRRAGPRRRGGSARLQMSAVHGAEQGGEMPRASSVSSAAAVRQVYGAGGDARGRSGRTKLRVKTGGAVRQESDAWSAGVRH